MLTECRRTRRVECGARMGKEEVYTRVLYEDLREGDDSEKPRHRMEDDIKLDLQEMECGFMDWIDLARNRDRWWALVNVVLNLPIS